MIPEARLFIFRPAVQRIPVPGNKEQETRTGFITAGAGPWINAGIVFREIPYLCIHILSFTMEKKTSLNLRVTINPGSGYCSGVIAAIRKAEFWLDAGEEVYCVGKIIHNDDEIKRLEKKGLHTICLDDLPALEEKKILFRAHGEPPSTYDLANRNGNLLIDATCKVVLKLQERIRMACEDGENVFLFGRKGHPEVTGLSGQCPEGIVVVEKSEDLESMDLPEEITLFSQTTRSLAALKDMAALLEEKGVKVKLKDTVCRQVYDREEGLDAFARQQDVVLFIAGKESSNGKVLFNICSGANPNSYYISSADEINHEWFKPGQKVGLAGATSTPDWLLNDVKNLLGSL